MDTTQTTTHVGLCAGYGGIELGLKRVLPALRTVALCEIEAFACANLVAKMESGLMEPAPIWTDLKTFPWAEFRDRVDILTGGYPCQPFSSAGLRRGTDDPRHLWPYIADGIRLMRPRVCFFENVEGHISLGLREVIADLECLGYETTWGIFSAAECGAPHQRKRVFILGHASGERREQDAALRDQLEASGVGALCGQGYGKLAHLQGAGLERYNGLLAGCGEPRRLTQESQGQAGGSNSCGDVWPSRPGEPQHAWEPPRVVEHSNSDRRECNVPRDASEQSSDRQDDRVSGAADSVGNAENANGSARKPSRDQKRTNALWNRNNNFRQSEHRGTGGNSDEYQECQTQPALGGDSHGPACGLDDAELYTTCENMWNDDDFKYQRRPTMADSSNNGCLASETDGAIRGTKSSARRQEESQSSQQSEGSSSFASLYTTCDNRTDELRLLGNGVVPATAALAFRTLLDSISRTWT